MYKALQKIKKQMSKSSLIFFVYNMVNPKFHRQYKGWSINNKITIIQRKYKQIKLDLPRNIAIEVISHCILDCEFCMLQSLKTWEYRRKSQMSFEEFKKIIDDIAWFTTDIQFSGGEPIMNKDLFKMLDYCREKTINTLLATNGILLSYKNNTNDLLEHPPNKIMLSYESPDKAVYELIRKKANSKDGDFEMLFNNIKNIIDKKKESGKVLPVIMLQMVLTKKNVGQVKEFWKSVKDLGADYGSVKALGIWPEGDEDYDKKMIDEYIIPYSENPISRHEINEDGKPIFFRKPGQCPATKHCYIGSGGEVLPCWYILAKTEVLGNALDDNFVNIWNSDNYLEYRYKMLNDWANPLCHRCIGVGATSERRKI